MTYNYEPLVEPPLTPADVKVEVERARDLGLFVRSFNGVSPDRSRVAACLLRVARGEELVPAELVDWWYGDTGPQPMGIDPGYVGPGQVAVAWCSDGDAALFDGNTVWSFKAPKPPGCYLFHDAVLRPRTWAVALCKALGRKPGKNPWEALVDLFDPPTTKVPKVNRYGQPVTVADEEEVEE